MLSFRRNHIYREKRRRDRRQRVNGFNFFSVKNSLGRGNFFSISLAFATFSGNIKKEIQ
jgi:hypothetical protein